MVFTRQKARKTIMLMLVGMSILGLSFSMANAQKISITIWDGFTDEASDRASEEIYASFEKLHPQVQILRQAMGTADQMHPLIKPALSSGTGPDIINDLTAGGYWRHLAKAELLLPLDAFYKEYDWNKRIFPWSKPLTTLGGQVYGIADELEFIGVYYNQDIFKQMGLSVPNTYQEFLAVCEKLKSGGYIPIAFANQGKWPAYHQFSIFVNNLIGAEKTEEILFGNGRWDTPEIEKAIKLFFVDMHGKDYFIPGTNGVTYDDGNMLFYSGRAAMNMTGTWLIGSIQEFVKDFETGFFYFPSIEGNPIAPPAGFGSAAFISSATSHPKVAASVLNYRFTETAARIWLEEAGRIEPISFDTTGLELSPLKSFVVESLSDVVKKGFSMGYNIDIYAPTNFNLMQGDGFQAVMAGQKTPGEQAADLQTEWEKAKEMGLVE